MDGPALDASGPEQDQRPVVEPARQARPGSQYVDVAKVEPAQGAPVLRPERPTPHSDSAAHQSPAASASASSRIATLLHTGEGLVPTSPQSSFQPRPLPPVAPRTPTRSPPRRGVSFGAAPKPEKKRRVVVQKAVHTLENTLEDLRALLKSIRYVLPLGGKVTRYVPDLFLTVFRSSVRLVAKMLHRRNLLASNVAYDLCLLLFKWIINLFFREIKPRGAHKIPKDGPVIFVAAPHHNQFLDPILLASEVRAASGSRRISFLIAEKSMKRAFVGLMARMMQSISVVRANDLAKPGKGKLYLASPSVDEKPGDITLIKGVGTGFKGSLQPKKQLMLPKHLGFATAEVVEVLSDDEVKVKKGFGKAGEALAEQGKKVEQGDKNAGTDYKILPYIDQTVMYGKVYEQMKNGGCLGIFPEGGSHDRTDLLPLKAGVSIMALGAMSANKDVRVQIVPVGLSYFHPHRFRSRAVIEFGAPVEIPVELVREFEKGSESKKAAIGKVMDLVYDGLKSVTVRAPDYETLQVIQAARRLYRPPDRQLSLGAVVELNKRFITGYLKYEKEPRVQALKAHVLEYNQQLRYMGMKDHQVERGNRPWWKAAFLLVFRAGLVTGWGVLALPGLILNAPMFIVASIISRQKAKEALAASTVKIEGRDVLATWKVLVSLGMAPPLYLLYIAISVGVSAKYDLVPRAYLKWMPLALVIAIPSFGYSALKFGEVGMDVYKSLRPLFLSLTGNANQLERLQQMRQKVSIELNEVIDEYAPQIWDDFDTSRIIRPPSSEAPPDSPEDFRRRKNSYAANDIINHPLAWLDERLFGWSQYDRVERRHKRTKSGATDSSASSVPSGFTSDEEDDSEEGGDFDSVVNMLGRAIGWDTGGESPARSRRSSRASRSKSQIDLAKLNETDAEATSTAIREAQDELRSRAKNQ